MRTDLGGLELGAQLIERQFAPLARLPQLRLQRLGPPARGRHLRVPMKPPGAG